MKKVLKYVLFGILGFATYGLFFIGYALFRLYRETKFDHEKIKALPNKKTMKIFGLLAFGLFVLIVGVNGDDETNQADQDQKLVVEEQQQEQQSKYVEPEVTGFDDVNEEEPEEEAKTEEELEAEKEAEYREFAGNLVQRVGYAMGLVGQGFTDWGQGKAIGRDQVVQGLKELNNEVKELDNLEPAKSQKELHKEIEKLVIGYRDTVEKALKAGDRGDANTLLKCAEELNELNNRIPGIMAKVEAD